ncbi:MAG: endonuclease/exonuclease/phosphatase family protein [Acidobacteria bacterium]|nr:endonuclease/exonuclease/phosphatase family protein [Acidobacteriota bacterium]
MHLPNCFAIVALFGFLRLAGHLTDPLLSDRAIHQIIGEPSRIGDLAYARQGIKVVTWNIERGEEFDEILSTLRTFDADVVLLQEADLFCRRSAGRNVAKELAGALGMNWLWAGEFQEIGESSGRQPALIGQAVLSKYPIEDPAVISFAAQARLRWRLTPLEPRRGGRIALRVRTAGVLVYNAHLESWGSETLRRKQLDEILTEQARHASEGAPVILGGDLNNRPQIRSSIFGRLTAASFADALAGASDGRRTSIRHKHPIDWIFTKNLTPREGWVAKIEGASDHYPVLVTLAHDR